MRADRVAASPDLRKPVAGVVLGLLALLLWSNRDFVSSWFATSYTATIWLKTTTATNDARIERAFAAVQAALSNEATLELIPGLRQIRNSVVHLPGASRAEAIATADSFSQALVAAFDSAGAGHLDARVRRRADPTPGPTSRAVLALLTFGAPMLGLGAILLCRRGWRDWRASPDGRGLPQGAGIVVAGSVALAIAPFVMPGWLIMALFAMAIPGAIAGVIVYKLREVQRAARWPSAQGRIVHARLRAVRTKQSDGSATVSNVPDIEYAYSVGDVEYHGKRIGIGDISAGSPEVEAALARYQAGSTGPVFYNPDNPNEAVLERDPPARPATLYAVAVGVLLAGFAVVIVFTRVSEIIDWLQPWFPPGAVVQGVLFCGASGLVTLMFLLSNRRDAMKAARWPTAAGTVLSSKSVSRRVFAPGRGNVTMEVWSPLVEFSFRVGGRDYHGARIAFGAAVSGGRDLAEATIARYPTGSAVTVHYDPANPSFAVLEPRVAFAWPSALVTAAFFAAAVFFSGWRGFG
jgi:Protein of unknown function (DUF3592)